MTIPAIQDFLVDWPGWATISPNYGDETSGQASGAIIVKELRPTLLMLDAQSVALPPTKIAYWVARLMSLQNGKRLFYGFDKTGYYPIKYPNGSWPTGGSFDGVSAAVSAISDNYNISLKSLPVGYLGSVGDYISITYGDDKLSLHKVVEDFTANGSGVTGTFAIEPYIRPGVAINDVVAVKRPACTMMMVPGSLSVPSSAWGAISFKGMQVF